MTPDQARDLLDGTTPGDEWYYRSKGGGVLYVEPVTVIPGGEVDVTEEDAALDPDTVLLDVDDPWREVRMSASEWMEDYAIDAEGIFPLAVIATGEHVRAARQALEEA